MEWSEDWLDYKILPALFDLLDHLAPASISPRRGVILKIGDWFGSADTLIAALSVKEISSSAVSRTLKVGKGLFPVPTDAAVKASLNGFTVLSRKRNLVIKAARRIPGEQGLIETSRNAHREFPWLAPTPVFTTLEKDFEITVEEFIKAEIPISTSNWEPLRTGILKMLLDSSSPCPIDFSNNDPSRNGSILALLRETPSGLAKLDEQLSKIQFLVAGLLERWADSPSSEFPQPQPTIIAHGDLSPSNTLLGENYLYLIDWTNGGRKNFTYDLFMSEIYRVRSAAWRTVARNFSEAKEPHPDFKRNELLFGSWYRHRVGLELEPATLIWGLVISCCEFALSRFRKYSSPEWEREGAKLLSLSVYMLEQITVTCRPLQAG